MTLLPEILEDEADGETLDCYNRLKAALPARTVNLIYRHLATVPGALPWATSIAERLGPTAFLEQAAQSLAETPVPPLPPLAPQYWHQHGVNDEDRHLALNILRVYNWSNPRNLVVLLVMQHHLDHPGTDTEAGPTPFPTGPKKPAGPPSTAEPKVPPGPPSTAEAALEPPALPDALTPDILQLVQQTCRQLDISPQLLPTLHRHLGTMPNLYRALTASTHDVVVNGEVSSHARQWEIGAAKAAELATLNRLPPTLPPSDSRLRIREAIDLFRHVIPVHCVLGSLWEDRLRTP